VGVLQAAERLDIQAVRQIKVNTKAKQILYYILRAAAGSSRVESKENRQEQTLAEEDPGYRGCINVQTKRLEAAQKLGCG
jgi:hypothetical protein